VADDDNTSRRLLTALLRMRGARVNTAVNGSQAIEMVMRGPCDLLILDRHMPVVDGIEAVRTLRNAGGAMRMLPIIGITAYEDASEHSRFLQAGLNGCLSKPVRQNELWSMIGHWVSAPARARQRPGNDASGMDREFEVQLLRSLVDRLAPDRERMMGLLDGYDYPAIADMAHAMAGAAATCNVWGLRGAALRLEDGARQGEHGAVVVHMRRLFAEMDELARYRCATA